MFIIVCTKSSKMRAIKWRMQNLYAQEIYRLHTHRLWKTSLSLKLCSNPPTTTKREMPSAEWRGFLFSCIIFIMCKLMFWSLFVTLQNEADLLCLRSSVSPDSPGVPPACWASAAQRGAPAELPQLRDAPPAGTPERQTVHIKSFNHNPSKLVKHSSIYRHHHKSWNACLFTFK